jgi:hypothetical protein
MVGTEIHCERPPPKGVVAFRTAAADSFRTVIFTGGLGYGVVVTEIHCERSPPKGVVSFWTAKLASRLGYSAISGREAAFE